MKSSSTRLIAYATAGSAALAGGAHIFQSLGFAPCHLCYLQRYPHYTAIVIGLIALVVKIPQMAWLGAAATLTTAGIGIYHSGVERDWWDGPASCTSSGVGNMSADQLLDQIMSAPLIRCDEIAWDIAGITMANLNVVISLLLTVVWVLAALRARKA